MAKNPINQYRDFRKIRKGDKGWTPELEKARRQYSPSTGEIITLRQYQNFQRGTTYSKYVKQREEKGIQKKEYKPKKSTQSKSKPKSTPKKVSTVKNKSKTKKEEKLPLIRSGKPRSKSSKTGIRRRISTGENYTNYLEKNMFKDRAEFLKNKYVEKISNDVGYQVQFNKLSSQQQRDYWEMYHNLVKGDVPSREEYFGEYADYYGDEDQDYSDIMDLGYGETP